MADSLAGTRPAPAAGGRPDESGNEPVAERDCLSSAVSSEATWTTPPPNGDDYHSFSVMVGERALVTVHRIRVEPAPTLAAAIAGYLATLDHPETAATRRVRRHPWLCCAPRSGAELPDKACLGPDQVRRRRGAAVAVWTRLSQARAWWIGPSSETWTRSREAGQQDISPEERRATRREWRHADPNRRLCQGRSPGSLQLSCFGVGEEQQVADSHWLRFAGF